MLTKLCSSTEGEGDMLLLVWILWRQHQCLVGISIDVGVILMCLPDSS